MKRSKSVEDYIRDAAQWNTQLQRLREVFKSTTLHEEVKWGAPCYTHNGKNVVGIGGWTRFCR